MPKSTTTANDVLEAIFKGPAFTWAANTDLFLALHTADPGVAGTQTTSEATYGSYARVTIARSGVGWTVATNTSTNAGLLQFPECSSGSNTITYVSVGTATSGTGQILYSGALNASRAVSAGIQPQFAINACTVTET